MSVTLRIRDPIISAMVEFWSSNSWRLENLRAVFKAEHVKVPESTLHYRIEAYLKKGIIEKVFERKIGTNETNRYKINQKLFRENIGVPI